MKVVAKERGFYLVQREAGDVFEFDLEHDGKRDVKRNSDGEPVLDKDGYQIRDPEGKKVLPSWMAEASDETVAEFSRLPDSHPTLDEKGRPYPYSVPYTPPGAVAPMDQVANAVNEVVAAAADADRAEEERLEASKEEAKDAERTPAGQELVDPKEAEQDQPKPASKRSKKSEK